MAEAFIAAAARTLSGKCNGKLLGWHPANLAAQVLDALMLRTGAGGLANVTITERV